jgi:predicted CXXCH cytochrome family protein
MVAGIAFSLFLYLHRRAIPNEQTARAGYVDPASCSQCHSAAAETFGQTGMSHSIYPPGSTNMVEDFKVNNTVHHQASGDYYTMIQRGDGYYQQRYQLGFGGSKTNFSEERIDYIIGSGAQARSYLHENAEGRLIELPVTWYAENNGHWGMTPGFEGPNQKDFHGVVSKDCIFCHDAYPAPEGKEIEQSGEAIFHNELPHGIDCQRCHGPGAEHERLARSENADLNLVRAAIVNPATLPRDRQLELCMECHLSTSGSQDSNVSLRFNRETFSYKPGTPLSDYKLYFDSAGPEAKDGFEIADAAYRLRMSSCFRNSQMTCLTCHNPHGESHGKLPAESYQKVCQSCHTGVVHKVALPATETCTSCHMPRRRGEYATQIVLTDHYIQRQKPLKNLLAPLPPPASSSRAKSALALYYPEQLPEGNDKQLYVALAESEGGTDPLLAAEHLQAAITQFAPNEAGYFAALGQVYSRAGKYADAILWFQKALQRSPNDRKTIEALAEALIASGSLDQAQQLLKDAVSHPPTDARLLADLGNVYARKGQFNEAESTLNQAIATDPELAQSYNVLGMVKEKQGDLSNAEQLYRKAIQNRPNLAEARNNLAKLLVANDKYDEAEFQFTQALASSPDLAEAHHGYGLLLIIRKRYTLAESQLRDAIRLQPDEAMVHSDLADLLAQTGHQLEANQQYSAALKLNPELGEANVGFGMLLIRTGDVASGTEHCRKASASPDPGIREQSLACLQGAAGLP